MYSSKYIEEQVEYILEITGVMDAYKGKPEASIQEIENYVETIRAVVTRKVCELIHAASLDSNLVQQCTAMNVKH